MSSLTWKSGRVKAQQCLTPKKQSWYTLPEMKQIVKIGAYARDPTTSTCSVFIPGTKQQAIELAKSHDGSAAYVDSSSRNSLVGIRTCWQSLGWPATASTISNTSTLSNFLCDLAGIEAATAQVWSAVKYSTLTNRSMTVFTDSQYALRALKQLGQDSGQFLIKSKYCADESRDKFITHQDEHTVSVESSSQ